MRQAAVRVRASLVDAHFAYLSTPETARHSNRRNQGNFRYATALAPSVGQARFKHTVLAADESPVGYWPRVKACEHRETSLLCAACLYAGSTAKYM